MSGFSSGKKSNDSLGMETTFKKYISQVKYDQTKDFISFVEFCGLDFTENIPEIIQDILYTLANFNLQDS
jgi:hypothetical protein